MSSRVNEVSGENLQDPPPIKSPGYANASDNGADSIPSSIAPRLAVYTTWAPASFFLFFFIGAGFTPTIANTNINHNHNPNRERKCIDTIVAVPVPWAGRFQC